jgi:glutamyl-tRNA synthetase
VGHFFIDDDDNILYDNPAAKKALLAHEGEGLRMLAALVIELQGIEPWSVENIEARMAEIMQSLDANLGKVGQPLRVAVSGGAVTPPLYETLVILGKERVLRRVERCLRAFAAEARG